MKIEIYNDRGTIAQFAKEEYAMMFLEKMFEEMEGVSTFSIAVDTTDFPTSMKDEDMPF